MNELKYHSAADAFPVMDEKRYSELLEDMRQNGQRESITLCEGMVLDGRNRYRACIELGIEPETKIFEGNPWDYAWSLNGQRRDLGEEQRYLIWIICDENGDSWQKECKRITDESNKKRSEATQQQKRTPDGKRLSKGQVVGQNDPPPDKHKGRKAKSTFSNVHPSTVKRADKLAKDRPDLAKKVRKGELKPAAAHRLMKKDELKDKATALPEGIYRVFYADPPWHYNDAQAVKGDFGTGTGAAEGHYPTMTLTELSLLDIPSITAEDSVLFLWATCPLLEDALQLCRSWGFRYKAQFVWDKVKHNMGHYNSVRHEILLICTKGSCTPDNVKLFDSVQIIERTEHSQKPDSFRDIIDTLYPVGPRIELFARGTIPDNWQAWGNEFRNR